MIKPVRNFVRNLGVLIGAIFLMVFFIEFFDWREARQHISDANWLDVVAATGCFAAGTFLRAYKWGYVLKLWERPSWRQCIHTMLVSNFANYFFPIRIGEIFRLYVINKVAMVSYSSSMATTVVDRASSLIIIVFVLVWIPFAEFKMIAASGFALWLLLFAVLFAAAMLFGSRFVGRLKNLIGTSLRIVRFPDAAIDHILCSRFANFIFRAISQCNMMALPKRKVFLVFALSFGVLCMDALANYFLLGAFGLNISPLQALISAGLLNVAFVLPSPPGQVGNAEIIPLAIFSYGLGLSSSLVSSAAVLWHLLTMGITALLGFYSSYAIGISLHDSYGRMNKLEKEAS